MVELWTLIVAIVTVIATVTAAYHVAVRQGVFSKPKLLTAFMVPSEEEMPESPTKVIVVAVPRSSRSTLLTSLPLVARNRGSVTIKNLWISIQYSSELAVQSNPSALSAVGPVKWPDNTRIETLAGNTLRIDHELPLVRGEETMVLAEPVCFDTTILNQGTTRSYKSYPLFLQSIAENSRKVKTYVHLVFVRADTLVQLHEQFSPIVQTILHESEPIAASILNVLISRLTRKLIRNVPCLLIVPHLRDISGVSVDSSLFGDNGTGYQKAEVGFYIAQLPISKPISKKKAKELEMLNEERMSTRLYKE